MAIRLHIERLQLDGPPLLPSERARFLHAFQAELERLLISQPSLPAHGGAVPSLPPTCAAPSAADPASRGLAAASALFLTLTGDRR